MTVSVALLVGTICGGPRSSSHSITLACPVASSMTAEERSPAAGLVGHRGIRQNRDAGQQCRQIGPGVLVRSSAAAQPVAHPPTASARVTTQPSSGFFCL